MAGDRASGALVTVDMHLHTRWSFDCRTDPEDLVRIAFARGLDHVCITDHNEIGAAARLREHYGGRVIIGEEVKTAERVDIIGLFLRERIPARTPAREACARIRAQGGLVYVPHPFAGRKGTGARILDELSDQVDIIEGFNARIHDPRRNEQAVAWATARGLPMGAGSDAHTLAEVGRAFVRVPPFDDTAGGFLESVRSAQLHGQRSSRLVHFASAYAKFCKRLPGGGTRGAETTERAR